MSPLVADWRFVSGQKKHTQDGSQLVSLMKSVGHGLKPVRAIDVGCGDGIIAFDILKHKKATKVLAVDILKNAVTSAAFNLREEVACGRAEVKFGSAVSLFRNKKFWDSFDRFVINPPFFKSGSGKSNLKDSDQAARHEKKLSLKSWARGAGRLLKTGGELYCVFPTERLAELMLELSRNRVEPKELWWFADDFRKRRVFLRAVRGARPGVQIHFDFEN